jgi:hypothetical protein
LKRKGEREGERERGKREKRRKEKRGGERGEGKGREGREPHLGIKLEYLCLPGSCTVAGKTHLRLVNPEHFADKDSSSWTITGSPLLQLPQ